LPLDICVERSVVTAVDGTAEGVGQFRVDVAALDVYRDLLYVCCPVVVIDPEVGGERQVLARVVRSNAKCLCRPE
jgi:hypothetical protein